MWVKKRKHTLAFLIFCLFTILCVPWIYSSDPMPSPSTLDAATYEAVKRFGDLATAHFLTSFYDLEGNPSVHLFLATKHQESIPEDIEQSIENGRRLWKQGESLIQIGRTEEGKKLIAESKNLLLQENRYGTLLISARSEEPFLIAFHHGLPTYVIAQTEAEERAKAFSNGNHATLVGVLYLSPLEYYFEFKVKDLRILVSPFGSEVILRADLEKALESSGIPVLDEHVDAPSDRPRADPYGLQNEDHTEADILGEIPDSWIIPGVPDYNQRPWLFNSCGPTAGATLLGYWDTQGYEDFLEGAETYDDVTYLIEELCQAMNWDPTFGVYYSQIPVGLWQIIDDRGYEFDISSLFSIGSLDIVRQEIIQGRPFLYGSQQNPWGTPHYVVVVGYEGSFIIVHDNWWSTPVDYFVNWDALGHNDDMMTVLVPEDQVGPSSEPLPSDLGGSGGGCFISTATQQ